MSPLGAASDLLNDGLPGPGIQFLLTKSELPRLAECNLMILFGVRAYSFY